MLDKSQNAEPATRHEVYYKDGVVIRVQKTLFKVPRYMFEVNAPSLAELLPPSLDSGGVGSSDESPVLLEDVDATDFERFLTIIYPIFASEDYPSAAWKSEEWVSILRIAHRWEMPAIKSMAIKNLDKLGSAASKIRLGRQYELNKWLTEGFLDMCLRAETLTLEEGQELDFKDVVGIGSAREILRAKVVTLEAGTTMFNSSRLGNVRVRIGKYEDGMKYKTNPAVRDIIESTFGIVTENPAS